MREGEMREGEKVRRREGEKERRREGEGEKEKERRRKRERALSRTRERAKASSVEFRNAGRQIASLSDLLNDRRLTGWKPIPRRRTRLLTTVFLRYCGRRPRKAARQFQPAMT